ncbi:hypothetical protein HYV12_02300 [Candidatus Dojkabacteria bacterium]|nr:hypothetical protein [Candidatus Dojkabacteria bacterium]
MAKTSRIKFKIHSKFVYPLLSGFVILAVLASLLTSQFVTKRQKEYEALNDRRNSYIDSYNYDSVTFNRLKDDLTIITVSDPTSYTLNYLEDLNTIELLNERMRTTAETILELTKSIGDLSSSTIKEDSNRVQTHEIYSNLLPSLASYFLFITDYTNSKRCFANINIKSNDTVIVNEIDSCLEDSLTLQRYSELQVPEFHSYWESYISYWNVVRKIHSKPKSTELAKLQKELTSNYKTLKDKETPFLTAIDKYFRLKYLEELQD